MTKPKPATAKRPMLISKIMQKGWASILEQNVPPEAHPELVKTFKRFYYAGAKHAIDDLLYAADLDEGMDPTAEDLSKIDALVHELNEYFGEVAAGRQ